jgi:hypothetical protein
LTFLRAKTIYLVMFGTGAVIGLFPFIIAIATGNNPFSNKYFTAVFVLGLCVLIGASIFKSIFFRCPVCKKKITSNYSLLFGLIGLIIDTKKDVKIRKCPNCFAELI